MTYLKKYLKYKNKYISLKKQIAGSSLQIVETNRNSFWLQYIGAGEPNFVYKDLKLDVIFKIRKNTRLDETANFINYSNSFNKETTTLTSDESITEYLTNFRSKLESNIANIDFNMVNIDFNMIKNYIEASKIINELPTFLKFKGIIVYNNIGIERYGGNIETPLVVPSFEYLELGRDAIKFDIGLDLKTEMLAVINDFKIYNSLGYKHGDLQNSCRNIMSYNDRGIRRLKVIDLENPKKFLTDECYLDSFLEFLLLDYINLHKCLVYLGFPVTIDKIDICNFIMSLDLDITLVDTRHYSRTHKYPEYKLNLVGGWSLQRTDSTILQDTDPLQRTDSTIPRDLEPLQRTDSTDSTILQDTDPLQRTDSTILQDTDPLQGTYSTISFLDQLQRTDNTDTGYYKITGIYDTDKSIDILINSKLNIEEFQRIIEVKESSYRSSVLRINLIINREKIKFFIESIYDILISKISTMSN